MKKKISSILLALALSLGVLSSSVIPATESRAADTVSVSYDVKYGQLEARILVKIMNEAIKLSKDKVPFVTLNELEMDYGLEAAAITRSAEIAIYNPTFKPTETPVRPNGTAYDTAYANPSEVGEHYELRLGDVDPKKLLGSTSTGDTDTTNIDPSALIDQIGTDAIINILVKGYKYIGIGHVTDDADVHYWVIEFSQKPTGAASTNGTNRKVTVTNPILKTYIKERKLKLGDATKTMYIGDQADLPKATGNLITNDAFHTDDRPAVVHCGTPTWSSSDAAVVSVSGNTKAVANKKGEATLTASATVAEGPGTGSYTVNVAGERIHVSSITLDHTKLTMAPADTITIKATISPSNATDPSIKWSSSNVIVASVAPDTQDSTKCAVAAISEGTAIITATTNDGSKTATCQINVSKDGSVHVDSIKISNEEITLYEGGSGFQLSASVYPDDAVDKRLTWETNDKSICQVSTTGYVTPVNHGTAHITVTSVDKEKSAYCIVTVKKGQRIPATSLKLNIESTKLIAGSVTNVSVDVTPKESTDILTWSTSDPNVASLKVADDWKSAVLTAGVSGEATIFVKSPDGVATSIHVIVRTAEEQAAIDAKKEAAKAAKTAVKKLKAGKKKMTVTVKPSKVAGVTIKYQIQYRVAGGKWKKTNSAKTSKTISNLKTGKKYNVRVRTYASVDGEKCYGAWSKAKSVKVK